MLFRKLIFLKERKTEEVKLVKFNSSLKAENEINQLRLKATFIDKKIEQSLNDLMQAQSVGLRSYLSIANGFWAKLQRERHIKQTSKALYWHAQNLTNLYINKIKLQNRIDRLTGEYWPKRIRLGFKILSITVLTVILLFVILMTVLASFSIFPFLAAFLVFFFAIKKRYS